jgi:hypothetical protein
MAREPLHFLSKKIHCHVCHVGGSLHATYTRDPGENACARVKCRTLGTDEPVGLSSIISSTRISGPKFAL